MSCEGVVERYHMAQREIATARRDALQIARTAAINDPRPYLELLHALNQLSGDDDY